MTLSTTDYNIGRLFRFNNLYQKLDLDLHLIILKNQYPLYPALFYLWISWKDARRQGVLHNSTDLTVNDANKMFIYKLLKFCVMEWPPWNKGWPVNVANKVIYFKLLKFCVTEWSPPHSRVATPWHILPSCVNQNHSRNMWPLKKFLP